MTRTDEPDPGEAIDQIAARGEGIRQRELQTAMDRLEAHGDLTAGQRAAVEELSETIVEELLAVPVEAIERVPDDGDALDVALELFAPDGDDR